MNLEEIEPLTMEAFKPKWRIETWTDEQLINLTEVLEGVDRYC